MSEAVGAWWTRLRRLASNLVTLLNVRLDLAVVETEVFVGGLIQELLLGIAGVLLVVLALVFAGLAVVMAVDEAHRWAALGWVAAGYLAGAGLCLVLIRIAVPWARACAVGASRWHGPTVCSGGVVCSVD